MAAELITSQLSATISGDAAEEGGAGAGNWLIIEQLDPPKDFEQATQSTFNAMRAQAYAGYDAHTAVTGCPVSYSGRVGERVITHALDFYVNKSVDVEYELEVTLNGQLLDYTGPQIGFIPGRANTFVVDKNKVQQLGWLAVEGSFTANFEIAFIGGRLEPNPLQHPQIEHLDGFIYLIGDQVQGSLRCRGTAVVDKYRVRIDHPMGSRWRGGLYATAYWPVGAPREDQNSFPEELFIPQCVEDKFNDCEEEYNNLLNQSGGDTGSTSIILNAEETPIVYISPCDGSFLGKQDQ